MWRLIVVTFGFLVIAFYQLSGGADYAPREGSRQHAANTRTATQATQAQSAPQLAARPASDQRKAQNLTKQSDRTDNARVVLASAGADPAADGGAGRVRLTLNAEAGANPGTPPASPGVSTVAADPDKIARLVAAATTDARAPVAPPVPSVERSREPGQDLRIVRAARVNLRAGPGTFYEVVGKLTQGTEVAILHDEGDGWVELRVLDSGEEGWMADFLLMAAN